MKSKEEAVLLPALMGDALALGPHWVYDAEEIARWYPEGIREYDAPRSTYHPGKVAGDLTHYGEQTLALAESVAKRGEEWTGEGWREDWLEWAARTRGYRDGATRESEARWRGGEGRGSNSSDLGGASRVAGLFGLPLRRLVSAAREQTRVTHGDPRVADAAVFFVRSALAVGEGAALKEAFETAAGAESYEKLEPGVELERARKAVEKGLEGEAAKLGLVCGVGRAFPLTLALALRYEWEPVVGLSRNAMLGGDSAARGLLLGMLFGARVGVEGFPESWRRGLRVSLPEWRSSAFAGS